MDVIFSQRPRNKYFKIQMIAFTFPDNKLKFKHWIPVKH